MWARVLVTVTLLVVFPIVALVLAGATVGLGIWLLFQEPQDAGWYRPLAVFGIAVMVALFAGLASVRRVRRVPAGVAVAQGQQPALWELVDEVARDAGTRPPDVLWVSGEANATAVGYRGRHLHLGLPLLAAMDIGQVRAVVAHELGHHAGRHSRFAALVHRWYSVMVGVVGRLPPSPLRALLRAYAGLYWLVAAHVLRRQELAADDLAVAVTGAATTMSALRRHAAVTAGWESYLELLAIGGTMPGDICGGFRDHRHPPVALPEKSGWGDTHPPLAQRVARLPATAPAPATPPAADLVEDWAALSAQVDDLIWPAGGRARKPVVEHLVELEESQRTAQADTLHRAAKRLGGTVGELLAAGRSKELVKEIARARPLNRNGRAWKPADKPTLLHSHVAAAIEIAAVKGGGHWVHHGQNMRAVHKDDTPLDAEAMATTAIDEHGAGLPDLGTPDTPRPQPGALLGALSCVKANHSLCVFAVLDNGFVLAARPAEDNGNADAALTALRARRLPLNAEFFPYEDLTAVSVTGGRRFRMSAELRNGTAVVVHATSQSAWTTTGELHPREILAEIPTALGANTPHQDLPPAATPTLTTTGPQAPSRQINWPWALALSLACVPAIALAANGNQQAIGPAVVTCGALVGAVVTEVIRRPGTRWGRGLGLIGSGLAVGGLAVDVSVNNAPWRLTVTFGLVGVLISGFGVARRLGSWPRGPGSAMGVVAGMALVTGVVTAGVASWQVTTILLVTAAVMWRFGRWLAQPPASSVLDLHDLRKVARWR